MFRAIAQLYIFEFRMRFFSLFQYRFPVSRTCARFVKYLPTFVWPFRTRPRTHTVVNFFMIFPLEHIYVNSILLAMALIELGKYAGLNDVQVE